MHTLTDEDLTRAPAQLLADARRGELSMVTAQGVPLLLAVPLVDGSPSPAALIDIAAALYDRSDISLGRAARIQTLCRARHHRTRPEARPQGQPLEAGR